jgi:hypothetical protein
MLRAMHRFVDYHSKSMKHPIPLQFILLTACLAMAGCASSPDVVQVGADTYLIEKTARTIRLGLDGLTTAAQQDASAYCESYGSSAEILEQAESDRPYIPGNFPRVEVRFRCIPWQ